VLLLETRLETHHNGSRFIVENEIVCINVSGKENLIVFDVVSDVSSRLATI